MDNGTVFMANNDVEGVRTLLRAVGYPGFRRDIVASGFVKEIEIDGNAVTIHFAPNTRNQEKVAQMEAGIRLVLRETGRFDQIEVTLHDPFAGQDTLSHGGMTPLQAELFEDGIEPEADLIGSDLQRPDLARQAGYDEEGPAPLGGPRTDFYDGELPVYQWEIDPHDPQAESGTANLAVDDWEFRVWWQVHPARLVYASIQAMREDWVDHDGAARTHPVGRSHAVNIVYDIEKKAVVAIYGTVQDFRPFVDAFYRGYVLKN
jgi:metal-sulfur cluster biosynthetic enzyme